MPISSYAEVHFDIATYLASIPYFAAVEMHIFQPANLSAQVKKALAALKPANGKSGMSIEISKPFLVNPNPESSGPEAFIEMRFLIKMQPTLNFGANGTGLKIEDVDLNLVQSLMDWAPSGSASGPFFPPQNFSSPASAGPDDPFDRRLVVMRAKVLFEPLIHTGTPACSGGGGDGDVTITVAAPDNAAPILYTTDGTAPGYIQGTTDPAGSSTLYAAPFAAEVGTLIRAVAIAPGKLPSVITYDPVTS